MYINITDSEKGDNKGSSGQLVHYLEKENRTVQAEQYWFNGQQRDIQGYQVRNSIDGNVAKLCRDDAKFFLVNISPSAKEIEHLKQTYGEDMAREKLKDYAVKVMDEYARNFKREDVLGEADLLWFGKLENHRYYSHRDKEVKSAEVKRGTVKLGEHWHVQVIVSRKDITNKIRLSPMNKSRGRNQEHSKKLGQFDRVAFKQSGERLFDETFGFDRQLKETFAYANRQVNGNLEQRLEKWKSNIDETHSVQQENREETPLEMLLERQANDPIAFGLKRKRKRRKGSAQNRGLQL